ncbi:MAG: hypothetical protein M0C28_12935 [Candidatus Moduliflexus flocculans]|nr:hypothetical protein [Candidatus Moduliflexus flocculans]
MSDRSDVVAAGRPVGIEDQVRDGVAVPDDEQAMHPDVLTQDGFHGLGQRIRVEALLFRRGRGPRYPRQARLGPRGCG